MNRCAWDYDGLCVRCGYRTEIPGLRRNCPSMQPSIWFSGTLCVSMSKGCRESRREWVAWLGRTFRQYYVPSDTLLSTALTIVYVPTSSVVQTMPDDAEKVSTKPTIMSTAAPT